MVPEQNEKTLSTKQQKATTNTIKDFKILQIYYSKPDGFDRRSFYFKTYDRDVELASF